MKVLKVKKKWLKKVERFTDFLLIIQNIHIPNKRSLFTIEGFTSLLLASE